MCTCNYTYAGPSLLVLPLFLISIVNLFVAGPPLKTVVLDSGGSSYAASLPFMQLRVEGSQAKFQLWPTDEITHFFVITCYAPAGTNPPIYLESQVVGKKVQDMRSATKNLVSASSHPPKAGAGTEDPHSLQMLQPLLGYTEYEVTIKGFAGSEGSSSTRSAMLPAMEYRVTYVPTQFTYTQICVRAFFTFTSTCIIIAYTAAMCRTNTLLERGQVWMTALLVLLIALNDPLYIARVMVGGDQLMYSASVLGQILFSGGLFLFWLVYADGMNRSLQNVCCFYLPKLLLCLMYVVVSGLMFLLHGRVPDRITTADALASDSTQQALVATLCASLFGVGAWLSFLVARAIYRLGWKKVEYIYTEREKSFVGITMVFVILWLCGHLYRAVHGRRGSWMQLQLPFLTLTNSYLLLLTHAFWPTEASREPVRPAEGNEDDGDDGDDGAKGQGLLDDED